MEGLLPELDFDNGWLHRVCAYLEIHIAACRKGDKEEDDLGLNFLGGKTHEESIGAMRDGSTYALN